MPPPDRDSSDGPATFALTAPRSRPLRGGLAGSLALHAALILLALFGLPWSGAEEAPTEQIVAVNLVQLRDKTAAPPAPQRAALPQETAKEAATPEPAPAVPLAQTPPPPVAQRQNDERSSPDLLTSATSELKPKVPEPLKAPRPATVTAARQRQPASPADDLAARLDMLARLRQPAAPLPPSPRQQEGSGASNRNTASAAAVPARDASYGVKDFIRAQVERRWTPDRDAAKAGGWTVSIHIMLGPDGSVREAEIVDDARHAADAGFRAFAQSARNAVLLSSPLAVPPGAYDIAKDIVVDFNPHETSR